MRRLVHTIFGRLCKRRALLVLARGGLSGFLNTKQTVCRRCVSPRIRKSDFCTFEEEKLRVSDCYKHGHRDLERTANCGIDLT